MDRNRTRKSQRGQALVEYTLILALVALVVIIAAFGIGLATQRIFGVVLGATGGKVNSGAALTIVSATCTLDTLSNNTGLTIQGPTTEVDPNALSASYGSAGLGQGIYSGTFSIISQAFNYNVVLTNKADASFCPTSVTVQDAHGAISVSQVVVQSVP